MAYIFLYIALLGVVFGQAPYLQRIGNSRNRILPRRLQQQQQRQPQLSALDQLMNVKTVEEFMALLRKDGRNVTDDDIFHKMSSSSGRRVTVRGGYLAEPDVCSPREMTVQLDLGDAGPDQVYFPRCTKVMRCGGCCSSGQATCRPVQVDRSFVNVLKGQVPFPGADYLIFTGFAKVVVERHLSCTMECGLSQEKCGINKVFLPQQCTCVCARAQRCLGFESWDPETCSCACSRTRACPNGQIFSQDSCQCENDFGKQETSHNVVPHPSQLEKYLARHRNSPIVSLTDVLSDKSTDAVLSAPAPPASPAEEPEEDSFADRIRQYATEKQDNVCSHLYCPPLFSAVMRSGLCVCTPREPSFSRYRRKNARIFKTRRRARPWRNSARKQDNKV